MRRQQHGLETEEQQHGRHGAPHGERPLLRFHRSLPFQGQCRVRPLVPTAGRMKRSTALAKPSSSLEVVTCVASRWTSGLAFATAMLSPLLANMSTSLGWSPIVAICAAGMRMALDIQVTTAPLLAFGWVTS